MTFVTRCGILNLSDSNLYYAEGKGSDKTVKEEANKQKIWVVDCEFPAAISILGSYSVAGESFDKWMPRFIRDQKKEGVRDVRQLAAAMQVRLEKLKGHAGARAGKIIQLSGSVPAGKHFHPEVWTVQDYELHVDPRTRNYIPRSVSDDNTFLCTEHFWSMSHNNKALRRLIGLRGGYWQYLNGTVNGRLALGTIIPDLSSLYRNVFANTMTLFDPPETLEDFAVLACSYVRILDGLYRTRKHDKIAYIGSEPKYEIIKYPRGSIY